MEFSPDLERIVGGTVEKRDARTGEVEAGTDNGDYSRFGDQPGQLSYRRLRQQVGDGGYEVQVVE
jgi:hypothetical protein